MRVITTLDALVDPFKGRCIRLAHRIVGENLPFKLWETFRPITRQEQLYRKGRSAAGKVVDKSAVVTNARPGESAHNWGYAADFVLDVGHPMWTNATDRPSKERGGAEWDSGTSLTGVVIRPAVFGAWQELGRLARDCDLVWGGAWEFRDLPHVELPGWKEKRPKDWHVVVAKALEDE